MKPQQQTPSIIIPKVKYPHSKEKKELTRLKKYQAQEGEKVGKEEYHGRIYGDSEVRGYGG